MVLKTLSVQVMGIGFNTKVSRFPAGIGTTVVVMAWLEQVVCVSCNSAIENMTTVVTRTE